MQLGGEWIITGGSKKTVGGIDTLLRFIRLNNGILSFLEPLAALMYCSGE